MDDHDDARDSGNNAHLGVTSQAPLVAQGQGSADGNQW